MRAHKYEPNYTVADYEIWEGDWELIDGYPYAMSPSATSSHQRISSKLSLVVGKELERLGGNCNNCELFYELDWIVNKYTVLRPDFVVVCNLTEKFITKPPKLIVELLSPSTALKDRHTKYEIYEEQGVPYYIIIDPETHQFNIFVLTEGKYVERNDTTLFTISATCAIELHLATVLAGMG